MGTHQGEVKGGEKTSGKHKNYYPAPDLCSFCFNILFASTASSRQPRKKRYKQPAVDSIGIINQVLILCLNPISRNEEWSKAETYHLRAEKREDKVQKANQHKRSKKKL